MRRTKEEAEKTRQDLLTAALAIFSRQGYAAARLADIAEAAQVTRGAIYHHFDSKAGLFMALIEEASAQGGGVIQDAIQQGGPFTDIVARVLVNSFQLLQDDVRFRQVFTLQLYELAADPELADFQQARAAQAAQMVTSLAGFFQAGIGQGELRPDLDPEQAARAFLAYQNGIAHLWLSNPQAFSIKDKAPGLAALFLNGIT